tara:strand:+ start:2259 stop:2951 length:693 start_codon:yes stop_codon:yes gene_type:complete
MKLTQINGDVLDLSTSQKFLDFASKGYSKSSLIVDQFNTGKFPPIPRGKTFLDIGGNVGLFSLFAAPYYEKLVILEPTPEHVEVAQDLIHCMGLGDKIEIVEKAYWPFDETVTFNVGEINSTMNSISSCNQVQQRTITVDCVTLETLFDQYPDIDFIKMDIEGAENTAYLHEDFKHVTKAKRLLMEVHSFPDLNIENIIKNVNKIQTHLVTSGMKTLSIIRDELYMSGSS